MIDRSRILASLSIALTMATAVLLFNQFAPQSSQSDAEPEGPAYLVSGRVVPADGPTPTGLRVRIRGVEDGRVRSVMVPVKPDGTFIARDLRPGTYTVIAILPGETDGSPDVEAGSTEVTIENRDVSGVAISLRRRS